MEIIAVVFLSYTIGSIPFGLIFTKIFISKDIRKFGSGNIGATNVLRTGNKFLALLTLLFDLLKGLIPVTLTKYYFPDYIVISCPLKADVRKSIVMAFLELTSTTLVFCTSTVLFFGASETGCTIG